MLEKTRGQSGMDNTETQATNTGNKTQNEDEHHKKNF